ncbi:class I SAM-dependent DNA methyltransferase, partial [Deinococcus ficus]|uniref:class I SAM-dependent DNA methyltransferase n=1 Tax=Deinococcus ficus TaxID=317577 RepID=UPI00174D806D
MTLSWTDIRTRAATFARDWQDETQENAGAQTFWNEFFNVFGVDRKRVAVFEKKVTKVSGASGRGRIDLLWPGKLMAEHKTKGKDLDAAFTQAQDYFNGLEDHELPPYVVVSDFARIRLYDLEEDTQVEFPITDFPQHVERFGFIAGFQQRHFREQDPVNVRAAEQMARLHEQLEQNGYGGHQLEVLLVRLLFLLFADDTGLFDQKGIFYDLIDGTRKDGTDLGQVLASLFEVLDTPLHARQTTLDAKYATFPYVNGELFRENIRMAHFDSGMRERLLTASKLDWGKISPAIFGSMFQGVMDPDERRALGAHYTSEANILKALGPLILDELRAMREAARGSRAKLQQFLALLPTLRFLDPACGCGNFLILAYRELRRLELDALEELHRGHALLNIGEVLKVNVGQFYGIEYEEFPSQVARVAMWLTDHQMNVEASLLLGQPFVNLPLADAAHIKHGDALETDWEAHLDLDTGAPTRVYIMVRVPQLRFQPICKSQRTSARLFQAGKFVRGPATKR